MTSSPRDFIRPWFDALEELDDFIGIRFGHQPEDASEPKWQFIGHNEVDGLGGLARIWRERGSVLENLPSLTHPEKIKPRAYLSALPGLLRSRKPPVWKHPGCNESSQKEKPPTAVSWHVFTNEETRQLRGASRRLSVSINSLLLKCLDATVRKELGNPEAPLFWMVPVNLRGRVTRARDEENHSSYVTARINAKSTIDQVHQQVHDKLAMGQHILTWKTYSVGRFLSSSIKKKIIKMNRVMAEPCLGVFSNLGQWDEEGKMTGKDVAGDWFFCPPVLNCQMISAGCLTFQNRLTLTLQVHPGISIDPAFTDRWLKNWISIIKLDFS